MAGEQVNELPTATFASGINIMAQKSEGGEGSTVKIDTQEIIDYFATSDAITFAGIWDQTSLPPSPEDGQFWIISTASQLTIGGVIYYQNDWLVYINSTVGWKKNPTNLNYLQDQIDTLITAVDGVETDIEDIEASLLKLHGALVFQGTWSASTNTIPTVPTGGYKDGQYWISLNEGTVLGVEYALNDFIVYVNSTVGWRKILNNVDFLQDQITEINNDIDDINSEITDVKNNILTIDGKITYLGNALVFQGGFNPSTNLPPVVPPAVPLNGQTWYITNSGSINSINYSVGDWVVYVNSTIGWVKVLNNITYFVDQVNTALALIGNQITTINSTISILSTATNLGTANTLVKRDSGGAAQFNDNVFVRGANACIQVSSQAAETIRNGVLIGSSGSVGAYFTDALQYDGAIRQGNVARKLLIGVGANSSTLSFDVNGAKFLKFCDLSQDVPQAITASTGTISSSFTLYDIKNTVSGAYTLEAASPTNSGRTISIKAHSSNSSPITISCTSLIDNQSSITLTPNASSNSYPSLTLRSDGTTWLIK